MLVLASLFFYFMGEGALTTLVLISIVMNYGLGKVIDRFRRPWILVLALLANLLPLLYFKYAESSYGVSVYQHLPLGISFFTLHALSYLIDVYRSDAKVCSSAGPFGLYILFFPQLNSGPIIRFREISHQLVARHFDLDQFSEGVRRFTIGLAKKVLIADRLGVAVDKIFIIPTEQMSSPVAWVGAAFYTVQIYFDFSGYTDMAIGLGAMFGFKFPENFNRPYLAQSLGEFWRRWHMSLSLWFRDYLYFPMGGSRKGNLRTALNLFTVFGVCGLWHGLSWKFLTWGLVHGSFLNLERVLPERFKPRGSIGHLYLIGVILITRVIFRAPNLTYATQYLLTMGQWGKEGALEYSVASLVSNVSLVAFLLGIVGIWLPKFSWESWKNKKWVEGMDVALVPVLLLLSLAFSFADDYRPFIYFKF